METVFERPLLAGKRQFRYMKHLYYGVLLILACGGTFLSFAFVAATCMWGCPETIDSYLIQLSFYAMIVLVLFIAYRWYRSCNPRIKKNVSE